LTDLAAVEEIWKSFWEAQDGAETDAHRR
jgi:hypothetical protein